MHNKLPYSINLLIKIKSKEIPSCLGKILQKAIILIKLNNIVNEILPISLRLKCRVANIRNNILILETVNASWKMRLHFEQRKLILKLREKIFPLLRDIDIIINPDFLIKKIYK